MMMMMMKMMMVIFQKQLVNIDSTDPSKGWKILTLVTFTTVTIDIRDIGDRYVLIDLEGSCGPGFTPTRMTFSTLKRSCLGRFIITR